MKQRRHYSSGRQYRRQRSSNDYSQPRSAPTTESNEAGVTLRAFELEAFPPATLLQEYEYATDGAANRLIDMALEEQQHRFAREEAEDRFNKKTIRISQFFGFISFLVILIETLVLFMSGREQLGLIIFFGALGAGFIASLSVAICNRGSVLKNHECKKAKCSTNQQALVNTSTPSSHSPQLQQQERRHNNGNGGNYRGNGNNHHRRRDDRSRGRRRSQRPQQQQGQ